MKCGYYNCVCQQFKPLVNQRNQCSNCMHQWPFHVFQSRLGLGLMLNMDGSNGLDFTGFGETMVEDLMGMILLGCNAIPVQLKILLDRLLSSHPHMNISHMMGNFGWNFHDYSRGYILMNDNGLARTQWTMCNQESELLIIKQFLMFPDTRLLAIQMLHQSDTTKSPINPSHDKYRTSPTDNPLMTSSMASSVSALHNINQSSSNALFDKTLDIMKLNFMKLNSINIPNNFSSSIFSINNLFHNTNTSAVKSGNNSEHNISNHNNTNRLNYQFSKSSNNSNKKSKISKTKPVEIEKDKPIRIITPDNILSNPTTSLEMIATNSSLSSSCNTHQSESSSTLQQQQQQQHKRLSSSAASCCELPKSTSSSAPNNLTRSKRRVLCTACKKTFCDKGALKIHYSAVHLREMHKCTVKGCNMWFSSRRSRNRHSSNPNPRLHLSSGHSNKKLPENSVIVDDGSGRQLGKRLPIPSCILNPPIISWKSDSAADSPDHNTTSAIATSTTVYNTNNKVGSKIGFTINSVID